MTNNNPTLDFAPVTSNNTTIPLGHANIFHDAFYIISNGLVLVAFIALLFALYAAVLWVHYSLVDHINGRLGTNGWGLLTAKSLTYISGHICGYLILATGIIIWASGEGSVSFVKSFLHALGVGLIILAFLLVVELAVIGMCYCAKADRAAKKPSAVLWVLEDWLDASSQERIVASIQGKSRDRKRRTVIRR